MNKTEAAQVLTILAAPHNRDVSVDTAEVWFRSVLGRVEFDEALEVAMYVVENEERFPTPAMFNSARASLARRARQVDILPALPTARVEPSKFITDLRATLEAKKSNLQRHWHGGPHPCPVCGGMGPKDSKKIAVRLAEHDPSKCLVCRDMTRS